MKKTLVLILSLLLIFSLTSCGKKQSSTNENTKMYPDFKVALAIDKAGVNDGSFNQSGWEAAKEFSETTGASALYQQAESKEYYYKNFDVLAKEGYDVIWCLGYNMQEEMLKAAENYPDQLFALVDADLGEETPDNVICVTFASQESAFISGYIASYYTETNNVGFVKGLKSASLDAFDYGFRAGVEYGAKELNKDINVFVETINTFDDTELAKNATVRLIDENKCDIVHLCAGHSGLGGIEVCKDKGIYAIGVDKDQNYIAPETVLTSSIKHVGSAVYEISRRIAEGEKLGGTKQILGIETGCTGVAPTAEQTVSEDIMDKVYKIEEKIKNGEITPPATEENFEVFLKTIEK